MTQDIRASYEMFPDWSQAFWTWMTGKPARDEQPVWTPSTWSYLLISLSVFLFGVLSSAFLVMSGEVLAYVSLIFTLPFAVQGARLMVLTIAHQCAHKMFCESDALNQNVHDVLTTLIFSQDYDSYRYDHFHVHHGIKTFGTYDDPVLSLIRSFGFVEGIPKNELWRRLIWTCVSPVFHARYFIGRLKYNLIYSSTKRRVFSIVWWSAVAAFAFLNPAWIPAILIAYILPITLLYQVSAFLELICEHVWMRPIGDRVFGKKRTTELSWGRFCGERVPQGEGTIAWLRWILRHVFYHLPCRVLVLTGDAPQHDFHHMVPNNRRWPVSAYERRDYVEAGKMEDREIWGLFEAIDIVFENISGFPEDRKDVGYLVVGQSSPRVEA